MTFLLFFFGVDLSLASSLCFSRYMVWICTIMALSSTSNWLMISVFLICLITLARLFSPRYLSSPLSPNPPPLPLPSLSSPAAEASSLAAACCLIRAAMNSLTAPSLSADLNPWRL